MTIGQLAEYVIKYRFGKAFKDWSLPEVIQAFIQAHESRTLTYTIDDNGNITGVCHANKHPDDGVIYICNILATGKDAMKSMVRWYFAMYPTYRFEARRKDRLKKYNNKYKGKFYVR